MAGIKVVCALLCVLAVQGNPLPSPKPEAGPLADSNPLPTPSGPNALPVSDPKPKPSPDPKSDPKPKPSPDPKSDAKPKPTPDPKPDPKPDPNAKAKASADPEAKPTAQPDPEAIPDAEAAAQQLTGRRFGLRRNNEDDDEIDEENLDQLPFFQSVRPKPTLKGAGEVGLRSPGAEISLTDEEMLERFPHLRNDPKMLRPIPVSSDGRLLIGAQDDEGRRSNGLEIPVGTGILVGPGQSRNPSTPFGNSFRGPFDNIGGRPFDNTGGRPFDNTGGRPFDNAGGRPFDNFGGRPFDNTGGRSFDNTGGRPFDDPFNRPFGTSAGFPQSPFSPGQSFFPQTGTPSLSFPGQRDPQSFSPGFGNSPSLFLNPTNTNSFFTPTTQRPFTTTFNDPRDRGSPRPTTPSPFSPFPTTFSNPSGSNPFSGSFPQSFSPNDNGSPIFLNPANTNRFFPRNPTTGFTNPQDTNSLDPFNSNPFFLNPGSTDNIPQNELPLFFRDPSNTNSIFPGGSPSLFFNPSDFPQGFANSRPDFSSPNTPTQFSPRPTTPNSLFPRPLAPPSLTFNPDSFSPQGGSPRPPFTNNFSPTTPSPFFPSSTPRPTTVSPGDFSFFPSSTPLPGFNQGFPSNSFFPTTSSGNIPFFSSDRDPDSPFLENSGIVPVSSRPRFPIRPTNTGRPGQGLFPEQPNFRYAPGYAYSYSVRDPLSGNYQGKEEVKGPDGVVRGSYHLLQPDGKTRVVTYTADDINGFRADVRYLSPSAYH